MGPRCQVSCPWWRLWTRCWLLAHRHGCVASTGLQGHGQDEQGQLRAGLTWKVRDMGARLQAFLSLVVAMSSTLAASDCSAAPGKRFTFHTSACFLASYLALPARDRRIERCGRLPQQPAGLASSVAARTQQLQSGMFCASQLEKLISCSQAISQQPGCAHSSGVERAWPLQAIQSLLALSRGRDHHVQALQRHVPSPGLPGRPATRLR